MLNEDNSFLDTSIILPSINQFDYIEKLFSEMPFTRYQVYTIISVILLGSLEGSEFIAISLSEDSIIKNNKGSIKENMISFIMIGNFFGYVCSILFSNYQPKTPIYIGMFIIMVSGPLSLLYINYFLLFRIFIHKILNYAFNIYH